MSEVEQVSSPLQNHLSAADFTRTYVIDSEIEIVHERDEWGGPVFFIRAKQPTEEGTEPETTE